MAQLFYTGSGAPSTAPLFPERLYVDTVNGVIYTSKGTTDASDWVKTSGFMWQGQYDEAQAYSQGDIVAYFNSLYINIIPSTGIAPTTTSNWTLILAAGVTGTANGLIDGGGIVWLTGYTYKVSAATYSINGIVYASPETIVTLPAADSTYTRIDLIIVDTNNVASVLEGSPAASPVQPTVSPTSEFSLTFITVPPDSTTDPGITTEAIFTDASSWAATHSGTGVVTDSTVNPYEGVYCIEFTDVSHGVVNRVDLIRATPLDPSTIDNIVFYVSSKAAMNNKNIGFTLTLYSDGVKVGNNAYISQGRYGFDSTNPIYQQVVVPLNAFGVPAGMLFDTVRFASALAVGYIHSGWYIDDVFTQAGISANTANSYLLYKGEWNNTTAYAKNSVVSYGNLLFFALQGSTATTPVDGSVWKLAASTALDTDGLDEGSTNLYHTGSRVLSTILSGFTAGTGTVVATDTLLQAIQKLAANITAAVTGVSSVNGESGGVTLGTDDINEGSTNQYFTNARTFLAPLTAFTAAAGTISISDTLQSVLQKLQGNIEGKQASLGFTAEDSANKSTSVTTDATSDTKYPSVKSIYDWVVGLSYATSSDLSTGLSAKLDASVYNPVYLGRYTSLGALETAYPTSSYGKYAIVDPGTGTNALEYIYDEQDGWVPSSASGTTLTSTDGLTEGSTNLYFTDSRVRSAVLAGISFATSTAAVATDTVLVVLGKLQAQLNSLTTVVSGKQASLGFTPENSANKDVSGGYVGRTLNKINFSNDAGTYTSFFTNANASVRTYTFKDADGMVAFTTDVATTVLADYIDTTTGVVDNTCTVLSAIQILYANQLDQSNYLVPSGSSNTKYLTGDGFGGASWTVLNTSKVPESGANVYFTNARTIAATLTGFTSGAGTVVSTDSVLAAIQKIVGNLAAWKVPAGGTSGQVLAKSSGTDYAVVWSTPSGGGGGGYQSALVNFSFSYSNSTTLSANQNLTVFSDITGFSTTNSPTQTITLPSGTYKLILRGLLHQAGRLNTAIKLCKTTSPYAAYATGNTNVSYAYQNICSYTFSPLASASAEGIIVSEYYLVLTGSITFILSNDGVDKALAGASFTASSSVDGVLDILKLA